MPVQLATTDSECPNLPDVHNTLTLIINAILKSKDPNVTLPNEYADSLERIIAAQFQVPALHSFMVISSGPFPAFETHLYFYIRRDGSITEPLGIGMSLNHVWENALMNALETVAQHKLFPRLPKTVDQDSVLATYIVGPGLRSSTRRVMRLVSLTVPWFPNHTPPVRQKDSPVPAYPEAARQAGAQDTVWADFVVGANGRAIPGTIDITDAHYQEFVDAVAAVIPQLRFTPAMMDGCAVNANVILPFRFTLSR